jgi:polyphosphate:AMP phosphotransferase
MLTDDGAVIIKLWFHLSKKAQKKRLRKIAETQRRKLTPWEKSFSDLYDPFLKVTESAVRHTDTGNAPWHIVESEDARYRDLMAGRILLAALEERLALGAKVKVKTKPNIEEPGGRVTVLDRVDLAATIEPAEYEARLVDAQTRLNALVWKARKERRSVVAMFEGWDAAGKGGAIRRVTAALDARLFRVISVAAPTDEERDQHYLWRFWRHLPRAGYVTIYDRSWYGRVLVERVEGFAGVDEWGRAYQEINDFERQLTDHGIVLAKFWLHISPEEQLKRFEERGRIEHKKHKITEEDWRNREKWPVYEEAVDEMVARCSTAFAPWTLVPANSKYLARIAVVETLAERIEQALG